MAVQKLSIAMTVCRQDRPYKDYTSNPIPTCVVSVCPVLLLPFLYLVSVVFGTAIPTSLYIIGFYTGICTYTRSFRYHTYVHS